MAAIFFVLTLVMPSFGGEVTFTIEARTEAGCEKMQALVRKQMGQLMMRYEVTPCEKRP